MATKVAVVVNGHLTSTSLRTFGALISRYIIDAEPEPLPPDPGPDPVPPDPVTSADWVARSTAPGVVLACPFISDAELQSSDPNLGLQSAADGTLQGSIDLTDPLSTDTGWLRFLFRKGVGDKNIGGALSLYLGKSFKAGDKLYVQWRQKFSPEYLQNNLDSWRSSIKHVNIHGASKTCQSAEVVCCSGPNTSGDFNLTQLYTHCGDGFDVHLPDGDILIQQGASDTDGYNCYYQDQVPGVGNGPGCFSPEPNIPYTFGLEVICADSATVTGTVAEPGGPARQFQKGTHSGFFSDDKSLDRIRLETYMTEINNPAAVDAFCSYAQLIVSTQPIALPQ